MVELRAARSGQPTALVDGRYLNSPYDPVAEAERFAAGCLGGEPPAAVLLLGAEVGHALAALRQRCPEARLLAVFYDRELAARSTPGPWAVWHPGAGEPLLDFLRRALEEPALEGLVVLEWPASARLFPAVSAEAHRQVAQLLREQRGSLATTAVLGRRWLRNCLRNFVEIGQVLAPPPRGERRPVLIAASGPSLERALPLLSVPRRRFLLWSLPSAVECLLARGLEPDLVVQTDSSWYARAHLSCLQAPPVPVAMPLAAATGAWRLPGGTLLLAQDAAYENELLAAAGYPAPRALPQGTVAATALQLALGWSLGPVVFLGLDLCFEDLRGHARPNLFERSLEQGVFRLEPREQRLFAWAEAQAPRRLPGPGRLRTGRALETYAGWFASLRLPDADRLYRLLPSAVPLPGLTSLDPPAFGQLLSSGPDDPGSAQAAPPRWAPYPDPPARRKIAAGKLAAWADLARRARDGLPEAGSVASVSADPLLSSLVTHFDAARRAEISRVRRLRGEPEAAAKAAALLEDLSSFLSGWGARLAP